MFVRVMVSTGEEKIRTALKERNHRTSAFASLKQRRVPLTPEERKLVMGRGAVWHHGPNEEDTPAVWKSEGSDGKTVYVTNTHRAYNTAPTLDGAIARFHKFIKSTA